MNMNEHAYEHVWRIVSTFPPTTPTKGAQWEHQKRFSNFHLNTIQKKLELPRTHPFSLFSEYICDENTAPQHAVGNGPLIGKAMEREYAKPFR